MGLQMPMDLRHRIHGDIDDDQQRRAAEIERQRRVGNQQFRQKANQREIERAEHRDPGQDLVDILRGAFAGPDARNEAAVFLQIVGGVVGLKTVAV